HDVLHGRLVQIVLDRESLELGRFDPATLLSRLDQRAGAFGLKQFGQLALGQVVIDVLSFLRAASETFRYASVPLLSTQADGSRFLPGSLIMDAFRGRCVR